MATVKQFQEGEDKKKYAYQFFISKGRSPIEASGIVGNLVHESNLNTNAIGDNGLAFGVAQWHLDRQKKAKSLYGDSWKSFDNQLNFVEWELNNTHKKAGDMLRTAKNPMQAGQIISDLYEMPKKKFYEDTNRQKSVQDIYRNSFDPSYKADIQTQVKSTYDTQIAPFIIPIITNFDNSNQTTNLAESETKKEEQPTEIDLAKKELEQKQAEKNFLEDLASRTIQSPQQQEQEVVQQAPQFADITQQYADVSNFVDNGNMQEGGPIDRFKKKPIQVTRETANTEKDNISNLTPTVSKQLTDKQIEERRLQNLINRQGEIRSHTSQSTASKVKEIALNPLTAFGYLARNESLPENFSKGERNTLDTATDVINPFFYMNQGKEAIGNTSSAIGNVAQGNLPEAYRDIKSAGMNTLNALPLVSEYEALGRVASSVGKTLGTEEGLLSNAHKLNPFAFKPNPEAYYRMIGDEGLADLKNIGYVRSNPNTFYADKHPFFSKGYPIDGRIGKSVIEDSKYLGNNMIEVGGNNEIGNRFVKNRWADSAPDPNIFVARDKIGIDNPNLKIYEKDWLQGYKQVEVPKSNFNSEINWGKWNKEIPENYQLMQEYNAIEQTSKANGSWMKNLLGFKFQGTPEQFVQQNSENFKKAFPNGFEETYRGTTGESPNLKPNRAMFTAESKVARAYAGRDNVDNILKSEEIVNEGGVHHLVYPKSENSLTHNTGGSHWTDVNLNSSETNIKNIDLNIQRLIDDIARKQKMMQEAFQNSDGSWSFPNSDLKLSNQLYKEGTSESERMLTKLKSQKNLIQKREYTSNPALLNKMKSYFGTDKVITDDIAEYIEKNNIDNVTLRNVEDGIFGDISIINHKSGNYLKSLWGNNGMFDMTNPNIYKAVVPGAIGLGALQQKKEGGIPISSQGVFASNHKPVIVPSPNISMKNVKYPILAQSLETGEKKILQPNLEYFFNKTKNVLEIPIKNKYE